MIKSVYDSNEECIKNIINLYGKIDCDVTYSKGLFYKNLDQPLLKFDINPQVSGVVKADSRNIPLLDNSQQVVMFDPPFLATTGKSLESNAKNNIINKRFSVFKSELELHQYYIDTLKELHRITKNNGYIYFKCQDKVSSGKQYMSHCFIYQEAIKLGRYPVDLFILVAKNRIIANWQKQQKHSRKFHSYFWILQKSNKVINYV